MDNELVEAVAVVQADREAAAQIVEWQNGTGWEPQFFHGGLPKGMREGAWDDHPVVQAFAAYRIALAEAVTPLASLKAENEALRSALAKNREAADDLLAPICAEAGRLLLEMPNENIVPHLPELPARLFKALYDATDERRPH